MRLETVEAVGPFGVGTAQPVVHGDEAVGLEPRRATLADACTTDEAGTLQHLEVFGDAWLRERGGLCQLHDTGLSASEALEDGSAGGIGKGGEDAAQRIVGTHNHKVI